MTNQPRTKVLATIALIGVIAIIGYLVWNAPDRRSPGEKMGDAVDALPNGPGKAVRQLENRTPGEKLEDAVKDAGDNLKKSND